MRKEKPFITVDVGALTESLFESELFGHVKGTFTDAKEDRIGKFEEADGGSIKVISAPEKGCRFIVMVKAQR